MSNFSQRSCRANVRASSSDHDSYLGQGQHDESRLILGASDARHLKDSRYSKLHRVLFLGHSDLSLVAVRVCKAQWEQEKAQRQHNAIVLLGKTGMGKSTLCRVLLQLQDSAACSSGTSAQSVTREVRRAPSGILRCEPDVENAGLAVARCGKRFFLRPWFAMGRCGKRCFFFACRAA